MSSPTTAGPKGDDIFAISKKGDDELKAADTSLSAAELQVLVLTDGFSSVSEIAQRVPGTSREDVIAAVRKLVAGKHVVSVAESDEMGSGFSTIAVPAGFFSSITADSNPELAGGASILKRKGYYVRIARRPAANRDKKEGWKPTILVVDDDLDLQKLIRTYLMMEGMVPRAALKRDDARMRQHPVLRLMPVIMLTAEATREAVLKGLQGGADGYVTKPFEPDQLIVAVKAVLGLSAK